MTYTITNEETGRTFTFPSEDAFEAASDWQNNATKAAVFEFCAEHGLDLHETTDDPYFEGRRKLVDDWYDAAAELYARVNA